MKCTLTYLLLAIAALLLTQGCTHRYYGYGRYIPYRNDTISYTANDTTQIIYEILVRTLGEELVPDFGLLKDRRNIFVLSTYFPTRSPGHDTTMYERFKPVTYVPYRVGRTRFALKTKEEVQAIANKDHTDVFALQIGYITIRGDEATTGIQTYGFIDNTGKRHRSQLSGGGLYMKFRKVDGHWVFIPDSTIMWIS